jgi:hypothetical protein
LLALLGREVLERRWIAAQERVLCAQLLPGDLQHAVERRRSDHPGVRPDAVGVVVATTAQAHLELTQRVERRVDDECRRLETNGVPALVADAESVLVHEEREVPSDRVREVVGHASSRRDIARA